MPDDRLIHLALGHSQKINALTDFERLVWLMYKLAADDFGVMRFSSAPLQDAADWLEQKPSKVVQRGLDRVRDVQLVATFEHQGRAFCYQPDWQTWQKILYPRSTKQPAPPLDALDLNTRWLFQHHPEGAKLSAWQHPDLRDKSRKIPGKIPESAPELSSPVLVRDSSDRVREGVGGPRPVESRSKRPVYTSDRFAVFEWQLDELSKTLGAHFENFDLHSFFDALSQKSRADGLVIPKADVWEWLQAQVLAEAKRRGLPMAGAAPVRDVNAELKAQADRVLASIQEDRRLRAGR